MRATSGFLLLEVGVALAIFLFMVVLTVPRLQFMHTQLVRAELERLYSFLHYVQACALATNKEQSVQFDERAQQWRFQKSIQRLPWQVRFGTIPTAYGPPSSPQKPLGKAITFADQKIIFSPDGTIRSGTIYLTDVDHSSLYALTVPIGDRTCLRKYRYDTRWIAVP